MKNFHINRRDFVQTTTLASVGLSLSCQSEKMSTPQISATDSSLLQKFYSTLSPTQKSAVVLPWDDPRKDYISNNWHVVKEDKYSIGDFYTSAQQAILLDILKNNLSPEGFKRYEKQMSDDSDGFGSFTCALFTEPDSPQMKFIFTGRHLTMRFSNVENPNVALGGSTFYGHAVRFNEKPQHPGNVWWHQSLKANEFFQSLDDKQKSSALSTKSPSDSAESVRIQGLKGKFSGLAGKNLSPDQKNKLQATLNSLLGSFPQKEIVKANSFIEEGGGLDNLHCSFFQDGDLGEDKIWDRWRIEGPGFIWYFRGSPHVHSWVNIAKPI